jgi:hypothetical protein
VQGEGACIQPAPATSDLTVRVRALYEETSVPVREIARLAGVNERTLYKYVEKHNWTRRYRSPARDAAAAGANSRWRRQRRDGVAPVKGAGGRFIRRADKDKPFATGLKAVDPAGRRRALEACAAAEPLAREAQLQAREEARLDERLRAMAEVNRATAELRRHRERQAKDRSEGRPLPPDDSRRERALLLALRVATDWWTALQ